MPAVSIVVPVYNVEKHLDTCLQSLVDQTLADIEIILVNDGSTDSSPALCDKWAQADPRIRVIHKDNGGLSDARNVGAAAAAADYIGFVDSDDYVDITMFAALYDDLQKHGADLATCDVTYMPKNFKETFKLGFEEIEGIFILDAETALKEAMLGRLPRIWVPTKIYPKRIFDEGFSFPLGKTYEDAYTIVDLFSRVEKVTVNKSGFYRYVRHEGTITTGLFSDRDFSIIEAWENCRTLAAERFPNLAEVIEFRCFWARFKVLDKMLLAGLPPKDARLRELVAYLRANKDTALANPYIGGGRKLALKFLGMSIRAYHLFVLLEEKRKKPQWG